MITSAITLSAKDGFIFSQTAWGAKKDLKNYIKDDEGYEWYGTDYKCKERLYPTEIWITTTSKSPTSYNRSTSYGAAGYIKNLSFVKETGEIADASSLILDE